MPLVHFLFRCPLCGHDSMAGKGDRAWCSHCRSEFQRDGAGGLIEVRKASGGTSEIPAMRLVGLHGEMEEHATEPDASEMQSSVARRARVIVRMATREEEIRHRGEVVGFCEQLGERQRGVLELSGSRLVLDFPGVEGVAGEKGEGEGRRLAWGPTDIGAIQTSSSSVQIAPREGGLVHFRFTDDSPKRWDGLLQAFVQAGYRREGLGEIVEFQPRIRTRREPVPGDGERTGGGETVAAAPAGIGSGNSELGRRKPGEGGFGWYSAFKTLARALLVLRVRTRVSGLHNIPPSGPFFLVANHQSVLDPILVQAACTRPLHTFTKSTQFSGAFFRWLLVRLNGIPTRRYRIDPQVVRVALRRLEEGRGVGIYPEGERSWDGALQPFRQGTVRLLLKAGVPVIPCGIDGSYDVWPRWSRRIKRFPVHIRFGEPIRWPAMDDRREREAAAPEATRRLRDALVELGAWSRESSGL